jgi:hypothetical protein
VPDQWVWSGDRLMSSRPASLLDRDKQNTLVMNNFS